MIQYGKQTIDKNDINAVVQVLKSDFLTQGPKVREFEASLAQYAGAKYAVVCPNGTVALHSAYLAAALKPGDEVIVPSNTFASTANMLLVVGAKPVFADIRLDTYNIAENKIAPLITKKTKAIVPVHFAGQPVAMDKIWRLAQKHKLIVIEDACHALGASFQGRKIGDCRYSHLTAFSFHPVKPITTGEGGAVLTNNKKLYERLLLFRNHGIYKDKQGKNVMIELGFNYRLTDIQAALGTSQLKKLDKFIKSRRRVVAWYQQELKNFERIILPQELPDNYSGWHLYIIRVKNPSLRDQLMTYLKNHGVNVNFHYPAVYAHPYYRQHGYRKTKLPSEEIYQASCITLPIYPTLAQRQVKYIAAVLKKFFIYETKD